MPDIFISYSQKDRKCAVEIEQQLISHGLSVWRDQSQLRAGELWNTALGEAIAASHALLLLWSENAAESKPVEWEWNTALAHGKQIMPCLIDYTPVPPSLKPLQWIKFTNAKQVAVEISAAFNRTSVLPQQERRKHFAWNAGIGVLAASALVIFGTMLWHNRIQANTTTPAKKSPPAHMFAPPTNAPLSQPKPVALKRQGPKFGEESHSATHKFAGIVSREDGQPLKDVQLTLQLDNGTFQKQVSDARGHFEFHVPPREMRATLIATAGQLRVERRVTLRVDVPDYGFVISEDQQ